MSLTNLLAALGALPPTRDEDRLHASVARVLKLLELQHWPEYELSKRNRIDFFIPNGVPGIGIECKTQGSALAVQRQLYRYAEFLHVLILVTTKPLAISSGTILDRHNKPCRLHVLEIWRNPIP